MYVGILGVWLHTVLLGEVADVLCSAAGGVPVLLDKDQGIAAALCDVLALEDVVGFGAAAERLGPSEGDGSGLAVGGVGGDADNIAGIGDGSHFCGWGVVWGRERP